MDWGVLFDFSPLIESRHEFLGGFWATIRLALTTGILALVVGVALAAMRVSPVPALRAAGALYVTALRNTPLALVLLFCSLGLSDTLHVRISGTPSVNFYWLAVIGLSVYTAAFVCEALRAGINTVPMGQAEAARAIGLTFRQSLGFIILPQAFRAVAAPLGNVTLAMIKNTTVALVASYVEAAAVMKDMIEEYGATFPIFFGFAAGFAALTIPTGLAFSWAAKRQAVMR